MSSPRTLAFLLLSLLPAFCQDPAEVADDAAVVAPAIIPGEEPTEVAPEIEEEIPGEIPAQIPAQIPAPAPPVVPIDQAVNSPVNLASTQITNDINEPKLTGAALAGLYRKYTGRRVIVSAPASTAEFSFVQESTAENPLTFAQAAELLKKAATIEGFVFVPDGQDPTLDFLTLSNAGIRPTGRGVDVYNENSQLPEGDAVISYVMTLSYIKPAEAVNTFNQIIGTFGTYGSIAPVPNASAVVITENTSLIRKLIDLKKEIDKPSSQVATRFIKVQFADVTEIAETITNLLTAQQESEKTAGTQRADSGVPAAPAAGNAPVIQGQPAIAGSGATTSGEAAPVQIIPDPRTNRIFAMGRPVDLLFIEGLIREFDVETSEKNFLRRKLKFLTVSDFLPIAGDALSRAFGGTGEGGGGGGGGGGSAGGGAQAGDSSGAESSSSGGGRRSRSGSSSRSNGANSGGGSGGSGGGGGSGAGDSLDSPDTSSAPESVLVGRTLLVADNITNSIVVQGPPSGLEIIERLLDQIDVKPDQVMISTVIGQLSLDDTTTFGLDYLSLGGDVIGGGGAGLLKLKDRDPTGTPGEAGFRAGKRNNFNSSNLQGGGLRVYGRIGNDMSVYLQALQNKGNFTVLSRPSIFTANNQKGTISSGERIAIPTSSNSFGGNNNSASTNIEYEDVVLKLEVIPLVNSNDEITMKIALLNDEVSGVQTIAGGAGGGGDLSVPKISTREILTTVTVPNNETIVLGGLIIGRNEKSKSGIPILSSIPYIGGLFGTNRNSKNRSELIVFMQPSIVNNDRSLENVQIDMDARYKVAKDAHAMADGPGVLPPVDVLLPIDEKGFVDPSARRTVVQQEVIIPASKPKAPKRPAHRR